MDVLVVDDDMALQRMMRHVLEKENHSVRVADSAEAGLVELRRKVPDLLVLDVRLPGMNGFDLCRKIRQEKEFGSLPVVFLTSKSDVVNRVAGLEIGGDDYVVKPFSAPELLARIKAVMRRLRPDEAAQAALTAGALSLDPSARVALLEDRPLGLTPKEFDLLHLFLQKKRKALTRAYLMERLWGREHTASSRTVDTHVKKIRRELGPLKDCLQTVERMGYRWVDPGDPLLKEPPPKTQ
jgi:DNA-binding response OmpR family regulator